MGSKRGTSEKQNVMDLESHVSWVIPQLNLASGKFSQKCEPLQPLRPSFPSPVPSDLNPHPDQLPSMMNSQQQKLNSCLDFVIVPSKIAIQLLLELVAKHSISLCC